MEFDFIKTAYKNIQNTVNGPKFGADRYSDDIRLSVSCDLIYKCQNLQTTMGDLSSALQYLLHYYFIMFSLNVVIRFLKFFVFFCNAFVSFCSVYLKYLFAQSLIALLILTKIISRGTIVKEITSILTFRK